MRAMIRATDPRRRGVERLPCALLAILALVFPGQTVVARAVAPPAGLAIVGAKVYPAPDAAAMDDATILIRGERIVALGPARTIRVPAGYRRISGTGRFVTAGFWNSHVHLTRPVFLRGLQSSDADMQSELEQDFTRWGFTTIFDLASTMDVANGLKARLAAGRVRGPRLLSVGDPFYPPGATPVYARPLYRQFGLPSAEIRSIPEAVARAERQIAAGADGVKLFTGSIMGGKDDTVHMDPVAVRLLATAAHQHHRPVFAHPTDQAGIDVAVENGVDILAHAAPIMGPWSEAYARGLVLRGVALIPTLSLFADAANPATPAATAVQQTRLFSQVGGVVLFGTDAGFTDAFDTSGEMRLMAKAVGWRGLLASLTTAPAKKFGEARQRGRVEKGFVADLVLLGMDPARDIGAMSDVAGVVVAGRIVYARGR